MLETRYMEWFYKGISTALINFFYNTWFPLWPCFNQRSHVFPLLDNFRNQVISSPMPPEYHNPLWGFNMWIPWMASDTLWKMKNIKLKILLEEESVALLLTLISDASLIYSLIIKSCICYAGIQAPKSIYKGVYRYKSIDIRLFF